MPDFEICEILENAILLKETRHRVDLEYEAIGVSSEILCLNNPFIQGHWL